MCYGIQFIFIRVKQQTGIEEYGRLFVTAVLIGAGVQFAIVLIAIVFIRVFP